MNIEGKLFPFKKTIKKLFELAGQVLEEDFLNVEVSVSFVKGEEIQALNKKFRECDKVTDVLSFPNLNKTPKQHLKEFADEINEGVLFLGDIVICRKKAKMQAREYGHSMKREVCFLALHGLLHLLGYDHIEKEDEKLMQKTAEKTLTQFGVTR